MRSNLSRLVSRFVPLVILMAVGCATAPAEEETAAVVAGASTLTIQNNHADGRDLIIYLEPEGRGERQNLGVIASGETRTITRDLPVGYYRLVGAHNTGDMQSDRFNVTGVSEIRWTVVPNRVTVSRRR